MQSPKLLSRLLREPLVGFLVAGAILFAVYRPRESTAATDARIVVSAGQLQQMVAVFSRTWMRHPTAEELRGLIRGYVLEEIHVREARAMGLDRDDPVIRRRLQQKLDFLTEDGADLLHPDDEVLAAFLRANEERFRLDPRYTFEQVYVSPDRHGPRTTAVAEAWLAALRAGEDVAGDPSLLPPAFRDASARELDAQLGRGFADALADAPDGEWTRVHSGVGTHLVRVDARVPGRLPELDEIRGVVAREWESAQRSERRARREAELLERFEVVVEWPEVEPAPPEAPEVAE